MQLTRNSSDSWTRRFGLLSAVCGGVTALCSGRVGRAAAGSGATPDPRVVAVLGSRQLMQGALVAAVPDPAIARAGALVDAAHALSMLPIVIGSSRYRTPAAVSLTIATAFAISGELLARHQTAHPA